MQIVFIRHGEPDYAPCEARGFTRALAPLTPAGREQARAAAVSPLLTGCELIVASPYTRALETAAIIASVTGFEVRVEFDLHEWLPDLAPRAHSAEEIRALHEDFLACRGEYPPGETRAWETMSAVIARAQPVLDGYYRAGHERIAVVTHADVIHRFTGSERVGLGTLNEIEYTPGQRCFGYV